MKRFFFYLMAVCLLSACFPDLSEERLSLDSSLEGKPVIVNFSVADIPVLMPTKAQGDIGEAPYLDPEKFYIVVCGHNQSIKYIRKVKYENTVSEELSNIPNYPLEFDPGETTAIHNFSVQLELSDADRTIHFLGNVEENQLITGSYAYQILPTLLSEEGKQSYWQSVHLAHILPKRDTLPDGTTQPVMRDGFYVLDEAIADSLRYVPLIKNYSKVRISNKTENFEIYSYAVVYQPKRGSVVPYRANADSPSDKFVFFHDTEKSYQFSGYERCNFTALDSIGYGGNLPGAEGLLDDTVPSEEAFKNPDGKRVIRYAEDENQGLYVYERGAPSASVGPTYIIIRGKFTDTEVDPEHSDPEGYYYYRLDLMETKTVEGQSVAKYYPLYRNFRYDIAIHRIASIGVSTPLAAVSSSGAEDISADWSMRHLSDISNGSTRLVVEPFMSQTYTGALEPGNYHELYVRYYHDIESSVPNMDLASVFVNLVPMDNNEEDIIILYDDAGRALTGDAVYYPSVRQSDGIRTIRFNTTEPRSQTKTQKIRITGKVAGTEDKYRLYREVEISLQSTQMMTLACDPEEVKPAKGSAVTLNITIPAGLPESMFPLEFVIEAADMTLTPDNKKDNNNLPVKSGKSLVPNSSKTVFQFVRTLTLSEYNHMTSGDKCTFASYFKTNQNESATTIWVDNKYFEPASVEMKNTAVPHGHFYVLAIEDCFVSINSSNLGYSLNNVEGEETVWTTYRSNDNINLEAGKKVWFKSTKTVTDWAGDTKFYCTAKGSSASRDGKFKVGGNIASLIVGDNYEQEGPDITGYAFRDFFKNHTGLKDASDLILPMVKCTSGGYKSMFDSCTGLEYGPELPSKQMAGTCYRNMFYNCKSLLVAPELPATSITGDCYQRMFFGCEKINLIKLYTKEYKEGAFNSDNGTRWTAGVADTGTIWLDPALKVNGELPSARKDIIVPKNSQGEYWTIKWIGIDPED